MNLILKRFLTTKLIFVSIFVFLVQYFFLPSLFQTFRFSDNTFFIYKYGRQVSRGLVYISLLISFLYPFLIWRKSKEYFKEHLVFVFIGFFPALYHIILYLLSLFF